MKTLTLLILALLYLGLFGCTGDGHNDYALSRNNDGEELANPVNSPQYISQLQNAIWWDDKLKNEEYYSHRTN